MSNSTSLADYRAALGNRTMRMPVLASVLGRMPIAMIGLALLLYTQHKTGSFGIASLVSGGDLVGVAIGSVIQGRLQDRLGPTRPLLIAAALLTVLATAEIIAVDMGSATLVLLALAVGAGAAQPNVSSASRALWQRVITDERQRNAAYSYEAISTEVFFVLGPGLAGLLIVAPWPGTGVVVGVVAMVLGSVLFALTTTVRSWGPAPSTGANWLGAMSAPGMRTVAIAALGFGLVTGSVEVAVQGAATDAGQPAVGGLLLSLWSAASVLFGVLYTLRPYPRAIPLRLPVLLATFAVLVGVLAIPGDIVVLGILMIVAGTMLAPQTMTHSMAIEVVAPVGTTGEAFGWVLTATTLGLSIGNAISGQLLDASGPSLAFLVAGICGLALAGVLYLRRGTVRSPAQPLPERELSTV